MQKDTEVDNQNVEAVKNFLLDIDCLEKMNPWINRFSLFDILKISRTEIRHSNVLAWLFDPNENHRLSDVILKNLFKYIYENYHFEEMAVFDLIRIDFNSFYVLREHQNIDILIVSHKEKIVLCIENKVDSDEHTNQLKKYEKNIREQYHEGYRCHFLFLTPDGHESSNPDVWRSISYIDIIDIIKKSIKNITLQKGVDYFIHDYIETLQRCFVKDKELIQICETIYQKHKKALDIIFEYRSDELIEHFKVIQDWCIKKSENGEIIFNADESSGKTYINFNTIEMDKILPIIDDSATSNTQKSKRWYNYLIVNRRKSIIVTLMVYPKEAPKFMRDRIDKLLLAINKSITTDDSRFKTIKSWKAIKFNEDFDDDIENKIVNYLNKTLKALKEFEVNIKKYNIE